MTQPAVTHADREARALPPLDGVAEAGGSLSDFIWFRTGGPAEWLVRPAHSDALARFMAALDPAVAVLPVGVGSNLIVRDGGVPGVVVRLPKSMAKASIEPDNHVRAGAAAMGITVASAARDAGIAGLEFLRGIPGTVGGAVRMNAGAYGRDVRDILVEATVVLRDGSVETWSAERLGYSYRHSALPEGAVVVEALFAGVPGDPVVIGAEMDRIAAEREASQPLRSQTGGSTFKNPEGDKAWRLIDAAGCRGLRRGQAQVSEKHCNFLLNLGGASAADIEALGEDVRAAVKADSGVVLEWEIQRVGVGSPHPGASRLSLSPEGEGASVSSSALPLPSGERDRSRSDQGEGPRGRGKTPDHLLERSRQLRAGQTEAESRLWGRLRGGRLQGLKFRRQTPIGNYIVDFLCPAAKLIVELGGSQHVDQASYDDRRTRFFEREGYMVLRIWNNDALARTEAALDAILAAASSPHPARCASGPSPLEGEGSGGHDG